MQDKHFKNECRDAFWAIRCVICGKMFGQRERKRKDAAVRHTPQGRRPLSRGSWTSKNPGHLRILYAFVRAFQYFGWFAGQGRRLLQIIIRRGATPYISPFPFQLFVCGVLC